MRWIAVWRRNFLVWRKLFAAAVLTNLADPLIMLFGLGYGLGALMPAVEGMSYISFFAAGQLCTATMYTASFESMFSGFSRMHGQKTWDAILYAPLVIDDIVAGEIIWAASKAWLTGSTILGIVLVFGRAHHDGARPQLGLLQLLHDSGDDADDDDLGRLLSGGAASRAAPLGGEGVAALSRGGAGAPDDGRRGPAARGRARRGAARLCCRRLSARD